LKIHQDKVYIPACYFISDKLSFKDTVQKLTPWGKKFHEQLSWKQSCITIHSG